MNFDVFLNFLRSSNVCCFSKKITSSDLPKSPLHQLRPPTSAVDGDLETYWATETGYPSAEFHLDLGTSQLVMAWESQVETRTVGEMMGPGGVFGYHL